MALKKLLLCKIFVKIDQHHPVANSDLNSELEQYQTYDTSNRMTLVMSQDGNGHGVGEKIKEYGENILEYGLNTKCMQDSGFKLLNISFCQDNLV